ncbi:hypothetical protein chiPu_0004927 [Chiloscyllium punctatum]|uniref:Uncharacterized protein n=1 Tax=Chiloscyllium punctatum TaxID=137246 RepID=A0A401S840_CHIPU|nr:hypothetical protein [Chiloscyllium punctatum]
MASNDLGIVVDGTQVSYIGQDSESIPEFLGRKYGHFTKRLDLSFNLLRSADWSLDCLPPIFYRDDIHAVSFYSGKAEPAFSVQS